MSKAERAADIRFFIDCFKACGKPAGAIGRAAAVSCGVFLHGCRGACWGLGTCVVWLVRCLVGLCTGIFRFLRCIFSVAIIIFALLLLVGSIGIVIHFGYLYWAPMVHFFGTIKNVTIEYFDKTLGELRLAHLWDKMEEYYEATKDKFAELGNHPEEQQVGAKTVGLYDAAKDAYEKVRQYETVQSAVTGSISFFDFVKSKIWE